METISSDVFVGVESHGFEKSVFLWYRLYTQNSNSDFAFQMVGRKIYLVLYLLYTIFQL